MCCGQDALAGSVAPTRLNGIARMRQETPHFPPNVGFLGRTSKSRPAATGHEDRANSRPNLRLRIASTPYYDINTRMWIRILFALSLIVAQPVGAEEATYNTAQLQADFDQLLEIIEGTHPDLGFVTDRAELQREAGRIRATIDRPMTVREAWMTMAQINPFLRDAHSGLRHPASAFDAYRESGGATFPVPVIVDRSGRLRVGFNPGLDGDVAAFEEIFSINGRSAEAIIAELMPRMRGETESLRRLVLAFNFPGHLWTLVGPQLDYVVEVGPDRTASRRVVLGAQSANPAAPFGFSKPRAGVALLRVASFDPSLRDQFRLFLDRTFADIAANGADTLLIDIRDNPGGAHDVSDLLVARLIDRPVSPTSRLTARITEVNREVSLTSDLGTVVTVPFEEPIMPTQAAPAYRGDIFVLLSENTYSQAIVFAATLRDHGIARLVGEPTGGAANQTGQISITDLANTGLQALAPLYIIYRPSGDESREGLRPDIALPHDPARPEQMVEMLLERQVR